MRCAKCGTDNRHSAKFCDKCGARLAPKCPSCGAENRPEARFCDACGAALATPPAVSANQPDAPQIRIANVAASENLDGERKTVTALFADIKGSMDLMEDLDPEEARAIVDPALKLMIDAVHRFDGYIVQSTGDGIFALFGAPLAHEDHPQRALYAALRMQEEMRRYSAKLRAAGNPPLEARVGINTGEVVVRSIQTGSSADAHAEYTPIGHATSLASRMQTIAPTGSIAVTEATQKFCAGYFIFKALGPTRVKGVTEPVNVFEVVGLGLLRTRLQRAAGRGLTKFVGRTREVDAMKDAAERAKSGHGQIVAAMAEAGVGKSRLFFEFKAISQSDWMVLETFSVSHGKGSTYLPLIELLSNYFGISSEDDARRRREKVAGRLAILDPSLEDTRAYIFALLGIVERVDPRREWEQNLDRLEDYLRQMQDNDSLPQMDPRIQRRRTLDAIKRILIRESLNQPLMVIFEDLHWIDEATQDFLNLLAESLANARILLLVNYRPEYSHAWSSKTYFTRLRLDPLGKESADEMLSALLGDSAELAQLERVIIERTEGNPFFMEETVQVLLDEGSLVRNGAIKLTRPIAELKIPPTVQAILAARIDRLPSEAKDLLQTLAVIGREFPLTLVSAVVRNPDDELHRMLDILQLGEFIYEQPAMGDTEYTFKHALTQEVAYSSVLMERRKVLHERAGAAIEALFAGHLDDHLDELAQHYTNSGNVPMALEYRERAGRQAVQRSANTDAMKSLTAAKELLMQLPASPERDQRELGLQTALGEVLMITKGWAAPETEQAYLRAQALAETGGTTTQRFSLLTGLFGIPFVGGRMREAQRRFQSVQYFVSQHPEPPFLMEAHHHSWSLKLMIGELEAAQHHVEEGLAFYEAQLRSVPLPLYSAHHPAVCGHSFGAIVFWLRGYPEAAKRHIQRAVLLAHEVGHPPSIMFALIHQAQIRQIEREVVQALEAAEAAMGIAEIEGFPFVLSWTKIIKGWALAQLGQPEPGLAQIREGLAIASATGSGFFRIYYLAQLADVCGKTGRIDEGLEAIAEALGLVQNGERWWEAEIHRLQADLLLQQNLSNQAEAQASLDRAIEIARQQGAKSLELRATMSFARLLRDTNRREEARAMLADIYNWFTEGFDSADLKDARALLDELSA
jgi:class 3 adenylate cyclase/predicted ATPase